MGKISTGAGAGIDDPCIAQLSPRFEIEVAALALAVRAQRAADIDWAWLAGVDRLGLTAGASAPELLVQEVIAACRERFAVAVEELAVTAESVHFRLPRALTA